MSPTTRAHHAVVIGAGLAGLTTATALTVAFERVTVLDHDHLPEGTAHRSGTPQGRHVHLLLAAGAEALEELFPGLLDDLVAGGAPTGDTDRFRLCFNGHRLARGRTGRHSVTASRPFVEAHVRERVRREPAVTIADGCDVQGLLVDRDGRRVRGVRIGAPARSGEQTLPADLVVDCSGRRSPLPTWLAELGYAQPDADRLRIDLRYATCRYHVPPELDDDLMVMVGPTPDGPRGGGMMKIEDGSWLVTLAGLGGERPPLEPDAFEAFAATFANDDIHEVLADGQPLDAPSAFRFPASVRHRYEQLADFPDGLLAAGDAVCSFNPIYGQGMTVAALEAATLRRQLGDGGVPVADRWFALIEPVIDAAWDMAVGADLALDLQGHRSLPTRLLNRYMAHLHAAAAHDPTLAEQFLGVTGLLDPPSRLLRPGTLARVVRGRLRRTLDAPKASTVGAR